MARPILQMGQVWVRFDTDTGLVDVSADSGATWTTVTATVADDAITSAKIGAGAVGTAELADDGVTAAKIGAGEVGTSELADDSVTAAKIGAGQVGTTELADDAVTFAKFAAAAFPAALVHNSGVQATASGSFTAITFDTEVFDVHGFHDAGANTERLTVPAGYGGTYLVGAHVSTAANGTGIREAYIYRNAAQVGEGTRITSPSGTERASMMVVTLLALAAGDYVDVRVGQTSGGSLNTYRINNLTPKLWAVRIGD